MRHHPCHSRSHARGHALLTHAALLTLTGLLTLAAGCTDFDTRYIVDDFRVLAVRAVDSPEEQVSGVLLLDPSIDLETAGIEDIASVFTVTDTQADFIIEPLIVDPAHPTGPFRLRARACPYRNENPTCDDLEDDQPVITAIEGIEGRSGRDLTFRFNAPPSFLNAALAADPLGGFGGLFLRLDIEIEGPSGRLRAGKTLTVNPDGLAQLLGLDPDRAFTPNTNPDICALRVHDMHVADNYHTRDGRFTAILYNEVVRTICDSVNRGDVTFQPHEIPIAYAGDAVTVHPIAPNDRRGEIRNQEEEYYVLTLPDGPGELPGVRIFTEQIQANIYVTGGSIDDDLAFSRTAFGVQISPEFIWYLPDKPGFYTVWVVLRDNRGGVGWIERTIEVRHRADLPVCATCPNDPTYDWTTAPRPHWLR